MSVSSSLITVQDISHICVWFIGRLAVVLFGIDASRLGAWFPGPSGKSNLVSQHLAYFTTPATKVGDTALNSDHL